MRSDFWMDSQGKGKLHCIRWTPEDSPKAVLQIVHGIADYAERYSPFAEYLNSLGILVTAEDHMGHGQSIKGGSQQGYFHGGWFTAVADTYGLMQQTMREYPEVPYVLFGHSMGSFMARTILCQYPDSGISAAVICGTCWQPRPLLPPVVGICNLVCRAVGEQNISQPLQNTVFGGYNKKVEHPRTEYDWISRDQKIVDAYVADPLCGFTPTCGLLREMMKGLQYTEDPKNLVRMKSDLPVFFIGGGDDPVGLYGKSIPAAASAFRDAGVKDVSMKVYPLGRHEILNEINRDEVFRDVSLWIMQKI